MHNECVNVGLLLECFFKGFTTSVTSFGVYADKCWVGAGVAGLKGCRKLERVGRNNTVIMIGRGYQCCGIDSAGFQVVEWGVAV